MVVYPLLLNRNFSFFCPHCGEVIPWTMDSAVVKNLGCINKMSGIEESCKYCFEKFPRIEQIIRSSKKNPGMEVHVLIEGFPCIFCMPLGLELEVVYRGVDKEEMKAITYYVDADKEYKVCLSKLRSKS